MEGVKLIRWLKEQTLLEYLIFVIVVGFMVLVILLNMINYAGRNSGDSSVRLERGVTNTEVMGSNPVLRSDFGEVGFDLLAASDFISLWGR